MHPWDTLVGTGEFLGETAAKATLWVQGDGLDNFILQGPSGWLEQQLIQGDPDAARDTIASGAGTVVGGMASGAVATAVVVKTAGTVRTTIATVRAAQAEAAAGRAAARAGLRTVDDAALASQVTAGAGGPDFGQWLARIEGRGPGLYDRPGFRKSTNAKAVENAPTNADGVKICETCGRPIEEPITIDTKNGPVTRRGYDLDHYPKTWAERVSEFKARAEPPSRAEVIDAYNQDVRPLCPPCNVGHEWEGVPGPYRVDTGGGGGASGGSSP
jgi:hypothetical protein